jgi:hypothetical protein
MTDGLRGIGFNLPRLCRWSLFFFGRGSGSHRNGWALSALRRLLNGRFRRLRSGRRRGCHADGNHQNWSAHCCFSERNSRICAGIGFYGAMFDG